MKLQELLDVPVQLKDPKSPGTRGLQLRKNRPQRRYFDYMHMVKEDVNYCANCGNLMLPEAYKGGLRKWFKDKWVRFGPDGKIRGDCARGSSKEGKPKCLPRSKANALGKKGRKSAASRKRRQDPKKNRRGKAKNVATKKK